MNGRAFLDLAEEIVRGGTEVHFRGASGRAYYGLFLECRDALERWAIHMLRHENPHRFVRLRFSFPADKELKHIGDIIDTLGQLRNRADYELSSLPQFATVTRAQEASRDARDALAVLDAIDADPARRANAVNAIQKAFP